MLILRSRKIVPNLETLDIGGFEPETPVKTVEGLNRLSDASPLSSSQDAVGSGSEFGRRRSVRLALKANSKSSEFIDKVEISGQKRKKFDCQHNGNCSNGFDSGTPECERVSVVKNGFLQFGTKEDMVTDQIQMKIGVLADVNKVGLEVKGTIVEPCGSTPAADLGTLGQSDDGVESVKKGKRKRRSSNEVDLSGLEYSRHDENEKKFLKLRSGKRIAKKEVKGETGESFKENEISNGDELHCHREGGSMSHGLRGNAGMINVPEASVNGAYNGTFECVTKFSREEKGEVKVLEQASCTSAVEIIKLEVETKEVDINKGVVGTEMHVETRSATRRSDKGKGKLVETDIASRSVSLLECKSKNRAERRTGSTASGSSTLEDKTSFQNPDHTTEVTMSVTAEKRGSKERFRDIAKRNAPRFAHFSLQEEEDSDFADVPVREIPQSEVDAEKEDWPGPFSTAMKIIKDRQMNGSVQQQNSNKNKAASIIWIPKKDFKDNLQKRLVPSLQDMCLSILVKHADAIASLDCIPDVLRHKISDLLCDSRRMSDHFLNLLLHGSPTEIHLRDCSWLTEDAFTKTFEGCDTNNLMVLQLDQCGRCLVDYILSTTLARSPNCMPALTVLSLKGAYRLSDDGLRWLASSAPSLRSINLSQCSLLTSDSIRYLAASLGSVLRELYIDDCQGIDAMLILPDLLNFDNLQVLSLADIESVSDDFIRKFLSKQGHKMKELVLANCMKLTDSSLRVIAETCSELCSLDLSNLYKLTDTAIGYLANGCRAIHTLKLCRNGFSDEAVAAYLETRGESLKELSLSNVNMVSQNTAISLARHSKNLHTLDLSWCRNLTDEALGLIVDSCFCLKVLKVFGCTQITNVFLDGYSNPEVQIVGLKMKPILKYLNVQGSLRY